MSEPARGLTLLLLGAGLVAAAGAVGVAGSEGTLLTPGTIDPWLATFAIGLAVLLGALPFRLHVAAAERTDDPERRWELALTAWGAVALGALCAFVAIGLVAGFGTSTPGGALALVGGFESGLILVGLIVLVLGT